MSAPGSRRLILFRHAKSAWDDPELDDHERPLNKRGTKAAPRMAEWLVAHGARPDVAICSDAVRTRATLALALPVFNAAGCEPTVVVSPALYLASAETILDEIRAGAGKARTVMAIGHNPGIHALALSLAGSGEPKALNALAMKFPTAAVAVYDLGTKSFDDILVGKCRLEAFVIPADLD